MLRPNGVFVAGGVSGDMLTFQLLGGGVCADGKAVRTHHNFPRFIDKIPGLGIVDST